MTADFNEAADKVFTENNYFCQYLTFILGDEVYGISVLAEAPQPVVVSNRLRNVPENAIWAWEPGAHFGIHRMDEFYIDETGGTQ